MSYNPTFPLPDSNLSSLYYYATNPSGSSNQQHQRTASPAASSEAPRGAAERDPFSAHVSPTPGHFTPLSASRNASASQIGWPPSARGTPLSHAGHEPSHYGSLNAFAGAPIGGSSFAGDQGALGQGFSGLAGYGSGGLGGSQASSTPDIPHSGLSNSLLGSASKIPGSNDAFNGGYGAALSGGSLGGPGNGAIKGAPAKDGPTNSPLNAGPTQASVLGSVRDLTSLQSSAAQSPVGAAAAPGFGAPDPSTLPFMPNWVYIDLSGALQGPFPGVQMTEWVEYFTDNVLLKREHDLDFVPFGALKEATCSSNPFALPFSDEMWAGVMRTAAKQANGFKGAGVSDEQSPLQPFESKLLPTPSANARARTVESSLADLKLSQDPSETRERNPLSYQPVTQGSSKFENTHDPQQVLDESSFQTRPDLQRLSSAIPAAPAAIKEDDSRGSRASMPSISAAQVSQMSAPKAPKQESPQPQQEQEHTESQLQSQQQSRLQPQATSTVDEGPKEEPWRKPSLQAVSLAELKQKEMEKQKKLSESSVPRKLQAKSWTQLPLGDDGTPVSPASRTVSTPKVSSASGVSSSIGTTPVSWNLATPVSAPKSLAEIQKEAQAKKVHSKPTYSSAIAQTSNLSTQTRVGTSTAPATSPYNGRFSALNEQAHSRAKQAPVAPPRATRPQAAAKPASVTAAASQAKPTDELIQWAKISFKSLSKDVNPMELLDVFLSLPANNEAKEFIAESIYSYSKTLDGRRFAHDFLSRKKHAEQSMKPGETWQDVLERFNPTVEQDPSFKVVTSKRVKPLARPEGMRA